MSKKQAYLEQNFWQHYAEKHYQGLWDQLPSLTLVIPTRNHEHLIDITVASIAEQKYPKLELIIVDANSSDRTLEIVSSFNIPNMRVFSVAKYRLYEMFNRGISLASSDYVAFLVPGDFYLCREALAYLGQGIVQQYHPSLLYCGNMLHEHNKKPYVMLRPLSKNLLAGGRQPVSLASCCFKVADLKRIGKFNTNYFLRGGYDLICRLTLDDRFDAQWIDRVLLDYEGQRMNPLGIYHHFRETLKVLRRHFGFWYALKWMFKQHDIKRLIKLGWHKLVSSFFKP
ncbi:MAG: glycosyltransferase [Chlamydiota bacterium]